MPYFAAAYCGARALPRTMTVEPMFTMLPWPWSSIRAPNSWTQSIVPLMSTARTWSIDSSVMSRQDICSRATSPTLFTRTSTPLQPFEGGVGHGLDLLPVDDVGLEQHRSAAFGRHPVGRPLGSLHGAAVVDADRAGALLGGAYRDLGAEAGAGAGDDDGPALEAARYGNGCCGHGVSFLSRWLGRSVRVTQTRTRPPSTYRTWPVMKRARSDARKVTASATSSGRPSRSAGTSDSRLSRLLSLSR